MKPKISLMNITNRHGGIDVLWANMRRQTFKDWELVLCDALWREREKEVKKYINDPRLKYLRQMDLAPGALTGLAHADNQAFANCDGELIVCLQDYVWINPRGLEKYWHAHKAYDGKILITGVGHQYAKPGKKDMLDEKGKITVFKEPYTGKPTQQCWEDPRVRTDQGTFYMCNPPDWELNWAAIPRKVIWQLGGMDEEYDFHGHAYDNVNLAVRADALGYRPYIDQTNICMGFDHDGWWPNPLKEKGLTAEKIHLQRMKNINEGTFPLELDNLQKYVRVKEGLSPRRKSPLIKR